LQTPGHHTDFWKNSMTYFHLQINTVAVTFAQISFLFEICTAQYVCRGRYVVPWISFLPLLWCHTSCSMKCDCQLKISPNSATIFFKWHDLLGFSLGIMIKCITLA
jgi:hypothetical protein